MTDEIQLKTLEIDSWTFRVQQPPGNGPHPVILMIHGWTGDENSMWVFSGRLPKNALLLAPRGLFPAPEGGYSWQPQHSADAWPWVDDFQPALDRLLDTLNTQNFPQADFSRLRLVGFSQGAALTYSFAMIYPQKISSFAGLSGFLPQGADALVRNRPLVGKAVFIAHGTQDTRVPVDRARQAVELLEQAGAAVTYCEDEVGHKLSAQCFRGLESFFR